MRMLLKLIAGLTVAPLEPITFKADKSHTNKRCRNGKLQRPKSVAPVYVIDGSGGILNRYAQRIADGGISHLSRTGQHVVCRHVNHT